MDIDQIDQRNLRAIDLMDRNIHDMNTNCCHVNIYLDFSKAYDSLNVTYFCLN